MSRSIAFPVFDADNHMYETTDAFTKYLPATHAGLVKYVEVNGRTKIALKNTISEYIPNPTFNVVAPPGAQELEFRLKNPSSKTKAGDIEVAPPPRHVPSIPAYFNPADRLELMNELSIDRAMMWPTLASLLEERLADDAEATVVVVRALNQWMHEHWTFNFENRIFPTPIITLPLLDEAIRELDWVVERGAKAILVRPAPVPSDSGRRRSFALPEFDPFWKRVEESGVAVGMHASDDGFQRYLNEWEGYRSEFLPFKTKMSAFTAVVANEHRTIKDVVTSIIGHGLATRFPKLRFMPVENGSSWVRPLVAQFEKIYDRQPDLFDEDPMVTWRRSVFVHPFHEEDVLGLVDVLGADNVLFGSDYPHPEGLFDPVTFIDEIDGLPEPAQRKIMGGNLSTIMGVDPLAKVL
ncbi:MULTISPECIES: amidohydrolase family protein [Pseudofrankia]|uniref:amidohydrolase family protein n=1 Tax=Pseudofrankia TaxID=2994363 RepID=UPI000234CD68|nr:MULTISPECIES: amidohydrolase family protein [Pseudofrankia]OHV32760.1 amidohydrolase [Pseudofrankia sp. EUN1h]